MGVLKGSSIDEIKEMVEKEYVTTFAVDTAVWPAAQAINFRFMPPKLQALYVNVISLGWAGFLSMVSNHTPASPTIDSVDITSRTAIAFKHSKGQV